MHPRGGRRRSGDLRGASPRIFERSIASTGGGRGSWEDGPGTLYRETHRRVARGTLRVESAWASAPASRSGSSVISPKRKGGGSPALLPRIPGGVDQPSGRLFLVTFVALHGTLLLLLVAPLALAWNASFAESCFPSVLSPWHFVHFCSARPCPCGGTRRNPCRASRVEGDRPLGLRSLQDEGLVRRAANPVPVAKTTATTNAVQNVTFLIMEPPGGEIAKYYIRGPEYATENPQRSDEQSLSLEYKGLFVLPVLYMNLTPLSPPLMYTT